MKLASTLLATYVGVPCLYYGTEVGLEGGLDPDCRRPFPWDKVESSTWIDFYKSLLAIRKQHKALQKGSIQYLIESEDVIVFARLLGDEKIITLLNLSNQQQKVTLPVWKLGCEVGLVKSLFSQTMTEIKVGELVVTLDAQRPEILVINK
jgi:alpha-glucosidase